mgnify:CR=1 FL=1
MAGTGAARRGGDCGADWRTDRADDFPRGRAPDSGDPRQHDHYQRHWGVPDQRRGAERHAADRAQYGIGSDMGSPGSADYLYRRHRIFGLATGQNAPRQKYLHVRQQH